MRGRYSFIVWRPIQLVPVLFGISFVTFVLIQLVPGDPARLMLGQRASDQAIESIRDRYGLDEPVVVQYGYYLGNLLQGDLGQSLAFRRPVSEVIGQRVWPTIYLLAYGISIALIVTVALSVLAARHPGGLVDQAVRFFCIAGLGVPSFWFGLMLIMFFSLYLGWFPVSGFGAGLTGTLYHMFLPALTIAMAVIPILTRNLRATLIAQNEADYVVAGRSKGLSARYVFHRHVFRNSLIPTVNLIGVVVSFLIGGTVVVETVFAIPGLGHLMIRAVLTRDYFVVQGVTLLLAMAVVINNYLVDIVTVALDPRIRL